MTLYETLFVIHPEKAARAKEFIDRFKKVVEGQEGVVSQVDDWGMRDLAYDIEKQGRGHYTLLRYRATGRVVEELERNLKLTDGILRYLTIRCDDESGVAVSAPQPRPEEPRQETEPEAPKLEADR